MIPKECKRLAEVDFPIAVVSKHSVREKSIRHGHPSTLHLWWARRPLAACRAILIALLLPDPCDQYCPEEFKKQAREILFNMPSRPRGWDKILKTNEGLRKIILQFIGDYSNWDNSADPVYLDIGQSLIRAAHPDETPLVVDPFAGGGSIPLEALRLGCDAFASDLNPVACLINKVMLEDIPRNGEEIAKELLQVGGEIKRQAEKELEEFYPKDSDGATPIAYLWARTVKCESPNCGTEIPLVRSFWLSNKVGRKKAIKYNILRQDGRVPIVQFELVTPEKDTDVPHGTINNGRAVCPACNSVLTSERLQDQLTRKKGGAEDPRLLAIVTLNNLKGGRKYRLAEANDLICITRANDFLNSMARENAQVFHLDENLSPVRPSPNARGVSAPTRYGINRFENLFLPRQRLSLIILAKLISQKAHQFHISRLLALALDKVAMQCNAHCRWKNTGESLVDMFGRHAISMVWDFAEAIPLRTGTGGWESAIKWISSTVGKMTDLSLNVGQLSNEDACASPLPDETAHIWFTDPPYYDNIPYSDLSDFFFVWLKRSLASDPLISQILNAGNLLTPKKQEIVWNNAHLVDGKPKGREFFETMIAKACREGNRILSSNGIGCIVFAHKTTEGWEALLGGMIDAGWVITASWPIDTEMATRVSARDSASLATSVHLVCRPRPDDASVGDWANVLRELPNRVGNWMERLQNEHIRGADLVFACIGPALEIFSQYQKVETADGNEVKLAEYLEKVWEVVGRIALEQILGTAEARARNGMAGALEEDSRLTALFLWTLQSTNGIDAGEGKKTKIKSKKVKGKSDEAEDDKLDDAEEDEDESPRGKVKGYSLVFDVVRRFAQPLGIELPKWEARIIETKKGVVRLMAVSERAKQLFGSAGMESAVEELLAPTPDGQMVLPGFQELVSQKRQKPMGRGKKVIINDPGEVNISATTLDRVHAAMLLQASGQANALRILVKAEQDRGSDFLRLANALSALYPVNSEEKRLLDAMLLAVPR